jgi:hypothetical protein
MHQCLGGGGRFIVKGELGNAPNDNDGIGNTICFDGKAKIVIVLTIQMKMGSELSCCKE